MPSLTTKRNSWWLWNSWQRGKLCGRVRRGAAREDMWKKSQFWSAYYFILENRSEIIVLVSCSVAKLCLILCSPMDCSMPGFPILHYLPEFAQTHVHWVSDAIQPSHPIAHFSSCPPSFPASGSFPMSWLFTSGGQSIWDYLLLTSPGENYILDSDFLIIIIRHMLK